MDCLAALMHNHGYVGVVERAWPVSRPRREAEYIRVITSELNRLQSHLLWLGVLVYSDLVLFTPIMYTFEDLARKFSISLRMSLVHD